MSHTKPPKRSSSRGGAAAEKATPTNRYREIPIQPPNVIARLMGIDAIPTKPAAAAILVQQPPAAAAAAETTNKKNEVISAPLTLRQAKCSLLSYRIRNSNGGSRSSSRHYCIKKMRVPGRSRHRHHPQEDLLQKMKHDFQAWQASMLLDDDTCSGMTPLDGIQMIAQQNLRKQKMARYGFLVADDSNKVVARENHHSLIKKNAVAVTETSTAAADHNSKVAVAADGQETTTVITVLRATSACAAAASDKIKDRSSSSASDEELEMARSTIVLLKPTSSADVADDGQTPSLLFGLPQLTRDANMTRFLEEVKEMLLQQANATNKLATWGSEPKQQIARDLAKDPLSKRLFSRSESFRGFRSDRRHNQASTKQASPDHVRILRRNILVPSLKSVASSRTETVSSPTNKEDEESMSSSCSITSTRERVIRSSLADVSPSAVGFGEQSFRSECLMMRHRDDTTTVSPAARALFRSFSAPESGFSFSLGRLFGDGSVRSTTPHQPSSQGAAVLTGKRSFSFIRGTVSSLTRHSFSLRNLHLFRRRNKTHWSKKTSLEVGEIHPQMAIATAPPSSPETTTFNLFKVAQANLTELPPSPVSPLEVVGHHFFSDLNCNFPELEAAPASELSYRTDITVERACSHDKAYIREVLVAAGLYDNDDNNNKANGRVDSMARPICDDIFEEVEDIYYYRGNYCNDDTAGGDAADHRLLFDLANEALQSLVMQGVSSMRQWVIHSTGVSRGRRLLDDVWHQVQALRNPEMQEMQTVDSMVAYEIRKSVWAEVLYDDVYVVGRKIERAIFDELIQDLLVEVFI